MELRIVAMAGLIVLGACTGPKIEDGAVTCGAAPDLNCPDGFECAADNFCYRNAGVCGNNVLDPGETCEPPEFCVKEEDCSDGKSCTQDLTVGVSDSCTSLCLYKSTTGCVSGDGCCPAGCSGVGPEADSDCSTTCGNGTREAGETCDPAETCETDCDDHNACTTDELTGSPDNCNVECVYNQVTDCGVEDGCCPASCTPETDSDCPRTCNDGILQSWESCDNSVPDNPDAVCPSDLDCASPDACKLIVAQGSPNNCNVQCVQIGTINDCHNDDGCCPPACTSANDSDCKGTCGNGLLEESEKCDNEPGHECPVFCPITGNCTTVRLVNAGTCQAECVESTIISCGADDGCCPPACDYYDPIKGGYERSSAAAITDSDCAITWAQ